MMTMSAAAAEYTLSEVLYEGLTALYKCNCVLPHILDVTCLLNERLNKEIRTKYLHMALSQFCVRMLNRYSQQCMSTTSYFNSASINGDICDNKDKCIQFFDDLCTEILYYEDNESDFLSILSDKSDILIVEHGVGEKRLKDLNSLYVSIFKFLCTYPHSPIWDTKYCQCETYSYSGDCNCEIVIIY